MEFIENSAPTKIKQFTQPSYAWKGRTEIS